MLLALDVGNTNITAGLFIRNQLKHHWRLETDRGRRLEDLKESFAFLLRSVDLTFKNIKGVAIANVVPKLAPNLANFCSDISNQDPLWVTPKTAKIPLRVESPEEVGADRLCNAVAAWEKWKEPTIVVDFGTATTLDIITKKGEYGGGAIFAGMDVANLSLARSAAQLTKIPIAKPKRVVGRNTLECMQAGLYHGYVGMVDHLVQLSIEEEGYPMKVVATGGLASLIAEDSKTIQKLEPHLTLEGLNFIWKKNT